MVRKALPGFFLCIFSCLTCLKKPVFSQPFTISKKWKNPSSALRRRRTGVQALPAIFDLFPWPTGLRHRSQITEGPVLGPFSYTKSPCKRGPHFELQGLLWCSRANLLLPLLRPLPATFNARSISREGKVSLLSPFAALADCVSVSIEKVSFLF